MPPFIVPTPERTHSDLVAEAERNDNHIPGLVGEIIGSALGILGNQDVHNQVRFDIPGLGPIPLDTDINTHGGKINAGLDLHVAQVARMAETNALTYAKAKAQAAIASGISSAISAVGAGNRVSVARAAGTGAPLIPIPANGIPVPGSRAASTEALGINLELKQEVPIQFGPTEIPSGSARPFFPNDSDPSNPYLTDALTKGEEVSFRAGQELDRQMTQAAQKAQARGSEIGLVAGGTDANPLRDLFLARESRHHLDLMTAANVMSGSNNRHPVSFRAKSGPERRGYFPVEATDGTSRTGDTPTDDGAYVPLVFTDLRPIRQTPGVYRSVYFQPFIKSLSEGFAPQWNMASFFGRVDKVATYQGTDRTINLAFKIACFSPEDLRVMYQKLGWLSSMVYPQYEGTSYFRGPVVRMRVGDVISARGREGTKGVPGVITSLQLNYDEALWDLDQDQKMPRSVDVTLALHVLHEHPVGLVAGHGGENDTKFGGIRTGGNNSLGRVASYVNVDRFRAAFGRDYLNDPNTSVASAPISGEPPLRTPSTDQTLGWTAAGA